MTSRPTCKGCRGGRMSQPLFSLAINAAGNKLECHLSHLKLPPHNNLSPHRLPPITLPTLSLMSMPIFESPTSTLPSSISTESISAPRTLRERCGFTLYLSFAPAFPNIPAKGELGPTAGNLPRRRKRSSVASIDIPAAPAFVDANAGRMEYFVAA